MPAPGLSGAITRDTAPAGLRRALNRLSDSYANSGGGGGPVSGAHATQITQSGFSVPNGGGATVVTGNSANFDVDGWFSAGANDRITVGRAGFYLVQAFVNWGSTPTTGILAVTKNGAASGVLGLTRQDQVPGYQEVGSVVQLAASDYLRVQLSNSSGGAIAVNTLLTAVLIGT